MAALTHPFKAEIEQLRQAILAADPTIQEGVKWNSPSFRTTEYFATIRLRASAGVQLILHRGARSRALPPGGVAIPGFVALAERLPLLRPLLQQWLGWV